jgi:hypothetical protein
MYYLELTEINEFACLMKSSGGLETGTLVDRSPELRSRCGARRAREERLRRRPVLFSDFLCMRQIDEQITSI